MTSTQTPIESILRSHAEWLEGGLKGQRADLSGMTLNDLNLSGVNLQKVILNGTALLDTNLVRADLTGAKMDRADAQRANFSEADLSGSTLTHVLFAAAWMNYANFSEITAIGTNF